MHHLLAKLLPILISLAGQAADAGLVCDALALAGAVCLLVGLALIYAPLAWLAGGLMLIGLAYWFALTLKRERRNDR